MIKGQDEFIESALNKKIVWDSTIYKILPEQFQNEELEQIIKRQTLKASKDIQVEEEKSSGIVKVEDAKEGEIEE